MVERKGRIEHVEGENREMWWWKERKRRIEHLEVENREMWWWREKGEDRTRRIGK